jgi:hypothetical protein
MVKTDKNSSASLSGSAEIVGVLKTLMIECSPLWSSEGWDQGSGGFIDRLDPDGRADHGESWFRLGRFTALPRPPR